MHLSRRFGDTMAVADATLRIEAGEMTGIIGPSGAGKSTLLRLINRLVEPSGGAILADGVDVTKLKGRALRLWRSRAAMIFQQFNLVNRLDVLTNVLIGGLWQCEVPRGIGRHQAPSAADSRARYAGAECIENDTLDRTEAA